MARHKNGWNRSPVLYRLHNRQSGILFVIGFNLVASKCTTNWDGPIKIIGVSCPQTRNGKFGLCPNRSKARMGVNHAANTFESFVNFQMCWCVRRGATVTRDNLANEFEAHKITYYNLAISHTAWLDEDMGCCGINAADIAKCLFS